MYTFLISMLLFFSFFDNAADAPRYGKNSLRYGSECRCAPPKVIGPGS